MKTIVWDVDDVLNDFTFSWFQAYREENRDCPVTAYPDLTRNPPHEILGVPLDVYFRSIDAFRVSDRGKQLAPNPLVLKWLRTEGMRFRHVALTARPRKTVSVLAEWVFGHFGDWIRTLSYVPAGRPGENLPVYDRSKAEALGKLGTVDFFIDDSAENVAGADRLGIRGFLFPQPWNPGRLSPAEILRELAASA